MVTSPSASDSPDAARSSARAQHPARGPVIQGELVVPIAGSHRARTEGAAPAPAWHGPDGAAHAHPPAAPAVPADASGTAQRPGPQYQPVAPPAPVAPYGAVPHGSAPYAHGPHGYAAPPVVVVQSPKSIGVSLVLTFFFGPLGMLYSTVLGFVIMLLVNLVVLPLTLGIGAVVTWPACMVWGALAASNHNARIQQQAAAFAYPQRGPWG